MTNILSDLPNGHVWPQVAWFRGCGCSGNGCLQQGNIFRYIHVRHKLYALHGLHEECDMILTDRKSKASERRRPFEESCITPGGERSFTSGAYEDSISTSFSRWCQPSDDY